MNDSMIYVFMHFTIEFVVITKKISLEHTHTHVTITIYLNQMENIKPFNEIKNETQI